MSKKIYCKDCKRFKKNEHDEKTIYYHCFSAAAAIDDFCFMPEKKEDDSCNSESLEYQHQVKIKTLEDKIEFLKDTQRVIIQSLKNDCREFSTSGNCRMYHRGCDTNCLIHHIIMKYNIP